MERQDHFALRRLGEYLLNQGRRHFAVPVLVQKEKRRVGQGRMSLDQPKNRRRCRGKVVMNDVDRLADLRAVSSIVQYLF